MNASTQGERLARIETLLETQASRQAEMAADIKSIRADLDAEKARNDALRNKGAGLLIGVSLFAGGIGAALSKIVPWLSHG